MLGDAKETTRIDTALEIAVNKGLAAARLNDRATGAKVMLAAGVPEHVVTRVLLGMPVVHRETDWQ